MKPFRTYFDTHFGWIIDGSVVCDGLTRIQKSCTNLLYNKWDFNSKTLDKFLVIENSYNLNPILTKEKGIMNAKSFSE